MKTLLKLSTLALFTIAMMACADDPVPETDPIEDPTTAMESPVEEVNNGQSDVDIESAEVQLERERADLELLLNKLMGSDIYFDYDKSKLNSEARDILSQVGDILLKEQKFSIVIEGHTDVRGTEGYNMSLGSKRAEAVRGYLIDYGVSKGDISTVSFGEESPKVNGESDSANTANRRANFQVKIK